MDVLTPEQRRLNMSRIKGKNTRPELLLRRGLHAKGLRFRIHVSDLPGKPDLVFAKYRAALLVNGCFWHGHNCQLFKIPATNSDAWAEKIAANHARDLKAVASLKLRNWRVLTVWECCLRGTGRLPLSEVIDYCASFVAGDEFTADLSGRK